MHNFKTTFNTENRECICKLTIAQAGYHGTNANIELPTTPPVLNNLAAVVVTPTAPATLSGVSAVPHAIADDGVNACSTAGSMVWEEPTPPATPQCFVQLQERMPSGLL